MLISGYSHSVSCCVCDFSSPYLDVAEGVGMKRRHDEDADAANVDELRESLLSTCINKLTAANHLRRRRALRHTVLINNLLRSLECPASKPRSSELTGHRARISARRRSSDSSPIKKGSGGSESMISTPDEPLRSSELSDAKKQQMSLWKQQQLLDRLSSPWELQQQPELLPSCDVDNDDLMSLTTTTFCPLLPVDLTLGLITPLSSLDDSQLVSELETLDVDCSSYDSDLNFFEPLAFDKAAVLDISLADCDTSALVGVLGNNETHRMDSSPCKMFSGGLDPVTVTVPVEC